MGMSGKLLRPSGRFTPKSISGLELWLDFSDDTTVTLNAGNVSAVADKSGKGRNFVQVAAAQQPPRSTAVKNGRNAIQFDAGKSLGNSVVSLAQPTTWFVVFQAPTTAGTWALFDGSVTRQHVFGNSATEMRMFAGSSQVIATIALATWYVAILTYNGASSQHRLSTTTATTANPGTNAIASPTLGSASGVRGNVGEVGLYAKALSDTEATALARYLAARWAITLT